MAVKKKMIIVSLDAVGSKDLEYMAGLPNFKAFMERAAICRKVMSVYPSLTYPAHTSIVTGRFPKNHGIVNNLQIQPERESSDWFWQSRFIKGTTIYREAAKKGMKVAALLWPVTGRSKAIAYNLPEVLPNRWWQNQILVSFFNGSPLYELDLQRRFGRLRDGVKQPQLDHFVHASMLYTLRHYQPDLMMVHLTDADTNRHQCGVDAKEVRAALRRHDKRLGQLWNTICDMGWKDEVNVVLLGDHYQKDTHSVIYPNYYLYRSGFITVKNGRIVGWHAVARDCDGSCYIYVKDQSSEQEVLNVLLEMKREQKGIQKIFTSQEAKALGADPECTFMLEAEPGYYFQNGWQAAGGKVEPGSFLSDPHLQSATHGYLPQDEGYQTFFMAAGPDFLPGAEAEQMSLVDEGPTLAHVLGLNLGKIDGQTIKVLLRT